MPFRPQLLAPLLAGLLLSSSAAAAPYLVRDLHQGSADGGGVAQGLLRDGVLYFASSDSTYGKELWRSDGTPAGTYRLTDICPGRCDSNPTGLEAFGGRLVFAANDGVSGAELWSSDGTPGTERQVSDVCPGPCSADPESKALGDKLLFLARDAVRVSLWRTDGSRTGTVRVAEVCPQICWPVSGLQSAGGLLLFGLGPELWQSDGTPGGTRLAWKPAQAHAPFSLAPIPAGGFAFFWTDDALWRTDGIDPHTGLTRTVRLKAMSSLTCRECRRAEESAVWKGALYSILGGGELVRSDGTAAGTAVLHTFGASAVLGLTPLADWLLFFAGDDDYIAEVWRTKGTPGTTERFLNPPVLGDSLGQLVPLGDRRAVFQVSGESPHPWDLWVTDGTEAGSHPIEGAPGSRGPAILVPAGDLVYFDPGENPDQPGAIVRTDGTAEGTFKVRDLRSEPGSGGPLASAVIGGHFVFSARTGPETAPLFVSDGTPAGTLLLSDPAQWADNFTQVGSRLFFSTGEMFFGPFPFFDQKGLWRTDGTPAGTARVSATVSRFGSPSVLGDRLLFAADRRSPSGDVELWRSEGTRPGTVLVKDINPFSSDFGNPGACFGDPSRPGSGVAVGGRLLFAADDGLTGRELWSSDGTAAGTRLVLDINPGISPVRPPASACPNPPRPRLGLGSDPQHLTALRGGALFTADDGKAGRELWWTDGTKSGTRRVADLRPGLSPSTPHDLTPFHGAVYFFASAGGKGEGLWRTDGTAPGTFPVSDLAVNGLPSWGRSLTVAGDRLFFAVANETTGAELWTSRGNRVSTRMVVDLRPGAPGSYPQALMDAGGVLVFAADDGTTGLEPWRSDGTAAGTFRLGDIHPGRGPSSPGPFARVGGLLLTGADDGEHGRELWAIPLADVRP